MPGISIKIKAPRAAGGIREDKAGPKRTEMHIRTQLKAGKSAKGVCYQCLAAHNNDISYCIRKCSDF